MATDLIQPEALTAADLPATFGRFQLLELLGSGAMGRVFRAEMRGPAGFKKKAAVKVMRRSVGADAEEYRLALIKEARIGAMLKHPNIVETYDFGETDDIPWISMEFIDGIGLERILRYERRVTPEVALDVVLQLLSGLAYAHSLEDGGRPSMVVHRALKPSNVMVGRDGVVKLVDFGIAKAAAVSGITTASGHTRGTPSYMSPEQTRGKVVDGRSDLFAACSLLYELVTGRCLFVGNSLVEVMTSIVTVDETLAKPGLWEPVDKLAPGLTPILRRGLRGDLSLRFPDADGLAEALMRVRDDYPSRSRIGELVKSITDDAPADAAAVSANTERAPSAIDYTHSIPPRHDFDDLDSTLRSPQDDEEDLTETAPQRAPVTAPSLPGAALPSSVPEPMPIPAHALSRPGSPARSLPETVRVTRTWPSKGPNWAGVIVSLGAIVAVIAIVAWLFMSLD